MSVRVQTAHRLTRRFPRASTLLASLLPLTLTGCLTTGSGETRPLVAADPQVCQAFHPIAWARNDTQETVADVKQHNRAWCALCRTHAPRACAVALPEDEKKP